MLEAVNIYKKYKRQVLNGVSLAADAGEIIGIAGENGSGKSTLLSILTSVVRPEHGSVLADGADVFKNPKALKKLMGYVPQEASMFENLTALDNLKFWASAYGTDYRNAYKYLFRGSGIKTEDRAFLKTKAGRLSGGMKKRLSIAFSLAHEPRYLIMDEPSAGLDIGFKWSLMDMMKEIRSEGRSIIFTTHSPDELLICDRLYVLRGGSFAYEGKPERLNEGGGIDETLRMMMRVNDDFDKPARAGDRR